MRIFFFFFIKVSLIWGQDNGGLDCVGPIETEKPPYYVTSATDMGGKDWENLKTKGIKTHYVPRGSVVYAPQSIDEGNSTDNNPVDVEVQIISLPDPDQEQKFRSSDRLKSRYQTGTLQRSQTGSFYSINKNSLVEAGDFVFFVRQDTPVEAIPGFSLKSFEGVKLVQENGKYLYQKCCVDERGDECFFHFKFKVVGKEKESFREETSSDSTFFLPLQCENSLVPVPTEDFEAISWYLKNKNLNIKDLAPRYPDAENLSYGNSKPVPFMIKNNYQTDIFSRYGTSNGESGEEDYLRPWSLCVFHKMQEIFNTFCPLDNSKSNCMLQVGDCYTEYTPSRYKNLKGWSRHSSHFKGECVDLLPIYQKNPKKVDLDKTRILLKTIAQIDKNSIVYFNNSTLLNEKSKLGLNKFKSESGHDTHLHICFDSQSDSVKSACRDDDFVQKSIEILSPSQTD